MNQVMENVEVKIITEENEVKTNSTDSEGLVELGPLAQGSDVTLSIFHPGYDNYNQNFVAQNDLDFIKIGLNPFVSK